MFVNVNVYFNLLFCHERSQFLPFGKMAVIGQHVIYMITNCQLTPALCDLQADSINCCFNI